MKLLGSTENKITKDKNAENGRHLEIAEVVLVYCTIFNSYYQHDSRVLATFVPNKSFGCLLEISPKVISFSKHLIQNFKLLKYGLLIKIVEGYRFLSFAKNMNNK